MGLFKEFKDDFTQAVNELAPGAETPEVEVNDLNLVVDTLGENIDVQTALSKLDGLLEQVNEPVAEKPTAKAPEVAYPNSEVAKAAPVEKEPVINNVIKEEKKPIMNNTIVKPEVAEDETSIITESTVLTGDMSSSGSFDVRGTINGNITCNGKIVVTGVVNGNTNSSELFADVAKVEGEIATSGTVKIGAGSVIIGNISASSAVIAGAVKGDIDVQGPVVVDTSAGIMGNIKSRSVQINNGAVIEGFCSQCYADIDVQGLFGTN